MLFSVTFILFFSFAFATPLLHRQLPSQFCSPNFEGTAVSVTNSAREWGTPKPVRAGSDVGDGNTGLRQADFRFEQTGLPGEPPKYIIKPVEDNNLVVSVRASGSLVLRPFNAADVNQFWNVQCDFCGTGASSQKFGGLYSNGCNVTSAVTKQCAQIGADRTQPLFLADCNGRDPQNFDFWLETA